jgi:AcrR family transcriptional regulator
VGETSSVPSADARRSRRDAIVRAAVDVFARRGFPDAGMQEIADQAGVARTVLYQEFASKEQLFEAALASVLDTVDEVVAASRPTGTAGPEALAPVIAAVWDWTDGHPQEARLLYHQTPGVTPESLRLRQDFEDRHIAAAFVYIPGRDVVPATAAKRWSLTSLVVRSVITMGLSVHALRADAAPLRNPPARELRQAAMDVSVRMMRAAASE